MFYLITIESGKNNIGGCCVHYMRSSKVVWCDRLEDVFSWYEKEYSLKRKFMNTHFGHYPDWEIVFDVKRINYSKHKST